MRTMPRILRGDPEIAGTYCKVQTLGAAKFFAKLCQIVDRELTQEEMKLATKMAQHNWTLRVVADALFGEEITAKHFEPASRQVG